jgi:hypothetical protein
MRIIIHPILFALFPVLFLYARNIRDFPIGVIVRPCLVAAAIAAVAWVVLGVALRNWAKAAIVVTLFVVLAFSWGSVSDALPDFGFTVGSAEIRTPYFVLAAFVIVFAAAARFLVRMKADAKNLTAILNFTAVCLVAVPAWRIGRIEAKNFSTLKYVQPPLEEDAASAGVTVPAARPNIFYIILDGYARADELKDVYGYDNSEFVSFLERSGFYVAGHARTNYSQTFASLASSLNMEYLGGLAARIGQDTDDPAPINEIRKHGRAREFLARRGYRFVSFATGYYQSDIPDADAFLMDTRQRNEFERGIINMTLNLSTESRVDGDRRRVLFALETLPGLARSEVPLFVFAHIVAPHPPYVFTADGGIPETRRYRWTATGSKLINENGLTRTQAMRLYVDQLAFINAKVTAAVDGILSNSEVPPVIVLQGDHGPDCFLHNGVQSDSYLQDRMSILNAYHIPGGGPLLYDTITPVNTFRVIFDTLFGAHYKMLPDRNYFTWARRPYTFTDITNEIGSQGDAARYQSLKSQDYFNNVAGAPASDAPD